MLLFRRNHTIAVIEPERPGNEAAPEILAGDGDLGPVAIMRHLHDDVSLEEGLTVRDLFECLAPFGPVLSLLGELDFDAWLDEVRQPASGPSEFSYIELHRTIDLMKQPRVDVPVVHDDSWCVRAVLGKPHEDEYMRQQVTSYGIDFLPGRRLANLPVVVAETGLDPVRKLEARASRRAPRPRARAVDRDRRAPNFPKHDRPWISLRDWLLRDTVRHEQDPPDGSRPPRESESRDRRRRAGQRELIFEASPDPCLSLAPRKPEPPVGGADSNQYLLHGVTGSRRTTPSVLEFCDDKHPEGHRDDRLPIGSQPMRSQTCTSRRTGRRSSISTGATG